MRLIASYPLVSRLAALGVCALLAFGAAVPAAQAVPSSVDGAQAEVADAQKRMDELSAELELRSENLFAAEERLAETREQLRKAESDLAQARVAVEESQKRLNTRAGSMYRTRTVGMLDILIGATDFRDVVTRLDAFRRISASDAALVSELEAARADVERLKRSLEVRREEQSVLVKRAAEEREAAETALAEQKQYLQTLDARLKTLIAEERARQEREARARAAAAAAATQNQQPGKGGANTGGGRPTVVPASGSVVEVARSLIGKVPYVWGGTTPSGFDCSGFTQYCYRQTGVSIPRSSRSQYNVGTRIPASDLDALRPGDLVFFGYGGDPGRIHHVGIYSGGGNYIHAPQTGMMVSESSLLARIARSGDYVGAVRP